MAQLIEQKSTMSDLIHPVLFKCYNNIPMNGPLDWMINTLISDEYGYGGSTT